VTLTHLFVLPASPRPSARWLACLLLALPLLASAAPAPTAASAAEMAQLQYELERDPAALNRFRNVLVRMNEAQMAQAITNTGNSHFTWMYPMILRAQDFPVLAGQYIPQMSVMAVRGDQLVPIPFQVDEFDERGLIFIPGVQTPGIFNPGGLIKRERKTDGVQGRFDNADELVFMFRDAGLREATAAEIAGTRGKLLARVELRRDGLATRYAYVMQWVTRRSTADYVRVDIRRGVAQTTMADIEWNPDSMAMLRKIAPRVGPSNGKNIVDGVYGEVSTGLMQKDLRFSLNTTDNIRLQPVGVKDGPVRAVMLMKIRIFYMGMPVFHDYLNVALFEQGASLLARVRLDSLDAAKYFINLIKEPRIEASIDFANLDGAESRWHVVNDADGRAIVDGKMSPIEETMNATRLPGDWLWMDSKRGWQFFFSNNFAFENGGMLDSFLDGMDVKMVYEDDPAATREGERIPGAGPRFGVRTAGMPTIVNSLLTSFRGIDLSGLSGVEDLMDQLILLDDKNKLPRLNQNINFVHQKLFDEGKIKTVDDIADLLVKDINRLGFKPDDKVKIANLARRTQQRAGSVDNFRIGEALRAAREIAADEGYDFNKLQYAMLDNTLWFPDQVGAGGPAAFDREVRNPPVAIVTPP